MSKRTIYSAIILLFLSGCEQFLEVELPGQEPKLVVNALLEPGDTLKVFLTKSSGILEGREYNDKFETVKNAKVSLTSGSGSPVQLNYLEKLSHFGLESFYYLKSPNLKANETYKLSAESPGFKSIESRLTLPQSVPIKELTFKNLGANGSSENYDLVEFTLKFEDLPGKNFYEIKGDFIGESTTRANSFYVGELYPIPVNPVYKRNTWYGSGLLFNDLLLNGKDSEMIFRTTLPRDANLKVTVILSHVSESYFLYEETAGLQSQTRNDFFSQPVLVYSNVLNGLGIFKARNSSTKILDILFED